MASNTQIFKTIGNREGVFGFGLSNNTNLDLLNLVVLACAGIIIKIFFQANIDKTEGGHVGPASTTIWGYGITAFALFILIFMSIYINNNNNDNNKIIEIEENFFTKLINIVMNDSIPIFLTFCVLIYIIYINFVHYNRINKGEVSDSYYTYSFYSSLLIIIQITLIIKYIYNSLDILNKTTKTKDQNQKIVFIKSASFILVLINLIFVMIQHILLAFYSTDG